MSLSRRIRRWLQALIAPSVGIALTAYFGYNLVIGERGLLAWRALSHALQDQQTRITALEAEHKDPAREGAELIHEHLDPDLLVERVRATRNSVAPSELLIRREARSH